MSSRTTAGLSKVFSNWSYVSSIRPGDRSKKRVDGHQVYTTPYTKKNLYRAKPAGRAQPLVGRNQLVGRSKPASQASKKVIIKQVDETWQPAKRNVFYSHRISYISW